MRFTKYQGVGNDFVMFADPDNQFELNEHLVARLCDRRFGVGGDGVIRVTPGIAGGDLFMDYWNSDGSIGEMCGNGVRCLALFAGEEGLTSASELHVDTRAGQKHLWVLDEGLVRVDMGAPIFEATEIPLDWDGDPLHVKLETSAEVVEAACVSMGNPHGVLFVEDPDAAPVRTLGPVLERNPVFPNGANIEFIKVESADRIQMRVWERGSGETFACGTGACAVGVIGRLLGGTDEKVTVAQPGGEVTIEWAGSLVDPQPVYMTGPAVKTFEGELDLEDYR